VINLFLHPARGLRIAAVPERAAFQSHPPPGGVLAHFLKLVFELVRTLASLSAIAAGQALLGQPALPQAGTGSMIFWVGSRAGGRVPGVMRVSNQPEQARLLMLLFVACF